MTYTSVGLQKSILSKAAARKCVQKMLLLINYASNTEMEANALDHFLLGVMQKQADQLLFNLFFLLLIPAYI